MRKSSLLAVFVVLSLSAPAALADSTGAFASPTSCASTVGAGDRLQKSEGKLRLVSWNIRWFPVGGTGSDAVPTDLAWLACALTWMDADIVALQEIQATPAADTAWAEVTRVLDAATGGRWVVNLSHCGPQDAQHVGFLWDETRVTLSEARDEWRLNGAAGSENDPCAGNLRPGRMAYVRSKGGLDFHLASVHLDSGRTSRDYGHRRTVIGRLDQIDAVLRSTDTDIVIAGDFNTMGTDPGAGGPADSAAEIGELRASAAKEGSGYRLLSDSVDCTLLYRGQCSALDHVLVSAPMMEAAGAKAVSLGYCALPPATRERGAKVAAALSDHCPVAVDLDDRDTD